MDAVEPLRLLALKRVHTANQLQNPVAMALQQLHLFTRHPQLLTAVLPDGLEHRITRRLNPVLAPHDRALDKHRQGLGQGFIWLLESRANGLGRLLAATAGEDREASPETPLHLGQERVAPIKRRLHRPLPRFATPHHRCRRRQLAIETG